MEHNMQTFMPEPTFYASLNALDSQRLGKQRVETKQILRALRGESKGWTSHPAVRMWAGYEGALCEYGIICCIIWRSRTTKRGKPYQDSLLPYFAQQSITYSDHTRPHWMGLRVFHRSHQSNLIRKDPSYYGPKWPDVNGTLDYYWPAETRALPV